MFSSLYIIIQRTIKVKQKLSKTTVSFPLRCGYMMWLHRLSPSRWSTSSKLHSLCHTSSSVCHPTKQHHRCLILMWQHPVCPLRWNPFISIFMEINIFSDTICTCGLFGAKISSRQTCFGFFNQICIVFQIFHSKLLDSTMAAESAEIYWMNKLLEIENMDWERQLKQTVSNLGVTFVSCIPLFPIQPNIHHFLYIN